MIPRRGVEREIDNLKLLRKQVDDTRMIDTLCIDLYPLTKGLPHTHACLQTREHTPTHGAPLGHTQHSLTPGTPPGFTNSLHSLTLGDLSVILSLIGVTDTGNTHALQTLDSHTHLETFQALKLQ